MMKTWYEIWIIDFNGITEMVAKVKSKGLAFTTYKALEPIYKGHLEMR